MTTYEVIIKLCKQKGIAPTALERELGFGNGSIGKMKTMGTSAKRLQILADYFGVSVDYLVTGNEAIENGNSSLTEKDEREIGRDLDRIMDEIENDTDGPLYYNGEPIDDESLKFLRNALELGLRELKKENKAKYGRKKKKD